MLTGHQNNRICLVSVFKKTEKLFFPPVCFTSQLYKCSFCMRKLIYSWMHFILGFPLLCSSTPLRCLTQQRSFIAGSRVAPHSTHIYSFSILLYNIQHHPTQADIASPLHPTHSALSLCSIGLMHRVRWLVHLSEWCDVAFCSSTGSHPNDQYSTWVFIKHLLWCLEESE